MKFISWSKPLEAWLKNEKPVVEKLMLNKERQKPQAWLLVQMIFLLDEII